jgi:peptidoglycan/xylan/chitin deacetylase (PgdA/CDA1 family)
MATPVTEKKVKIRNNPRRWCIAFAVTLLGLLLCLCLFNGLVDPFGVFGDPVFHWYSYNETNNPRAAKIPYLEEHHQEYDSYIIGASSTSSFPKEALDSYFDASFYNLISYGSDMLDVEETCMYVLENYEVKNLVINFYVASGYRYDESNDSLTTAMHEKVSGENPLLFYSKYLLMNPQYSWTKLLDLSADTYLPQTFDVFDEVSGAYDKRARDAEPIGSMDKYLKSYPVFTNYPTYDRSMDYIDEAVESVARVKEACDAKGVNFMVVTPPVYYDNILWYDKGQIQEMYEKLAAVTPFWDFSVSSVSLEPRYFYDETHFRNPVGEMALARIFDDQTVYVPEDFGKLITPDNAAQTVEAFWNVSAEEEAYTKEVPILCYHHITENPENDSSITPEQFRQEMAYLQENGYTTVSVDELIRYVEKGEELPEKPVCITFDDGYLSNYEIAFPILQQYGMKATIFVIGSTLGDTEFYKDTMYPITPHFNEEQAKEMVDSGLISIQSHTYDMHQWEPYETGDVVRSNILKLDEETEETYIAALQDDFRQSKQQLTDITGESVVALAFPGGAYDTLSQAVLCDLGVKATFSIDPGTATLVKGLPQSLYAMERYYVKPTTTEEEFAGWLS